MYTKQECRAIKAKVQAILDKLLKTAEEKNLKAGTRLILIAEQGNVRMEIAHTILGGTIQFFLLRWKEKDKPVDYFNLQYNAETRTVEGGLAFNEDGKQISHIQCWHRHGGDDQVFLDWLLVLVQSLDGKWNPVRGQLMKV